MTNRARLLALSMSPTLLILPMLAGAPASAADSPLPGVPLPVAATDVTTTDTDLGSASREVVVVLDGADGPEVRKLRTATWADARTLAAHLDARAGVEAQLNQTVSLPAVPTSGVGSKPGRRIEPRTSARAQSVAPLNSEQYGALQWGLQAVHAENAWAITRGSSVTVAVVDSGVDATHPDLVGHVLPQIDLVDDYTSGDPDGHGTHVAGIIAASLDGAGIAGLANQVSIQPVRVLDATGAGDLATVVEGIYAAANSGARVINLSLGSDASDPLEADAIRYAVDRGITVVAAGGNSYLYGNPVTYPAAYPGVIGVSAITPGFGSASFSNSGQFIDLAAPGVDILSTVPGGWDYADGSSMAAPFVSAAAALVRAANPALGRSDVESTLLSTALDDADGDGPDTWFGYGLVQADRAVAAAANAPGGMLAISSVRPAPAATVRLTTDRAKSKLRVDVDPNKGSGYWKFQVQRKRADGTWKPLKTYRTKGRAEKRTVNLRKGTYRVVVRPKYGYAGATSTEVYLKR